jgi:hypothetical protein
MGNVLVGLKKKDTKIFKCLGLPTACTSECKEAINEHGITIVDTPGLNDTYGRSIEFIDAIVAHMKQSLKYGYKISILLVVAQRNTPAVNGAAHVLVHCLKNIPSFCFTLVRNMVSEELTENEKRKCYDLDRKLFSPLQVSNYSMLVMGADDDQRKQFYDQIMVGLNFYSEKKEPLSTWTDILKYYKNAADEAVDKKKVQTELVEEAKRNIDQYEKDMAWHSNRIKDLTIATASTSILLAWVPFAYLGASTGMIVAIEDSKQKLVTLAKLKKQREQDLELFKNLENNFENVMKEKVEYFKKIDGIFKAKDYNLTIPK